MNRLYPLYAVAFAVISLPKGWSDGFYEYMLWLKAQGMYEVYQWYMTVWPKV